MSQTSDSGASGPLERYFLILEILASVPGGLTQASIARMTGLPKPAVHRLVTSLTQAGLLAVQEGQGKIYSLGRRMQNLAALSFSHDHLKSAAMMILNPLVRELDETCFIARLEGTDVRTVAIASPDHARRVHIDANHAVEPHAAASAKAILAFRRVCTLDQFVGQPFPRFTNNTHATLASLKQDLQRVREEGYALSDAEFEDETAAFACPVWTDEDVYFSIAVTGPKDRLMQLEAKSIVDLLSGAATQFSQRLGALDEAASVRH